jgi:predicted metal-binding membrane protein
LATSRIPLARERNVILGVLLALAAAAWALLLWQARSVDMDMEMSATPTMGMAAPLFLAVWVAMMVAIMFPTAAPMILTYARTQSAKRASEKPYVPTWIFLAGYMVVWTALGVVAYAAALAAEALAGEVMWVMENAGRIGGAVLVLAGVYQLTPLKRICLVKCRTPLAFIMTSWRDGRDGAFRMGLDHGLYCAGCCWLLFVILFPLGMLNIAAMAVITILIYLEKVFPRGELVGRIAGVALVAYGFLAIASPALLPTTM